MYNEKTFINDLDTALSQIRNLLIEKNRKYGNSALSNEGAVFSKDLTVRQRLHVRMDDKMKRLVQGESDDTEDTKQDLLGYLLLEKVLDIREDPNYGKSDATSL